MTAATPHRSPPPCRDPRRLHWGCTALVSVSLLATSFAPRSLAATTELGIVNFPVTCSAAAQEHFEHGVALLHHMTYPQARRAFEETLELDPSCAMAHWGIASTLFQPLWPTRPTTAELARGWRELETASALSGTSAREGAFLATAQAFFRDPDGEDYWLRIRRWASAAEQLYRAFPDDPEASALHALAQLATAPKDRISLDHAARAAELLLGLYRENPEHPGAMHYMIHANDAPGRERELLEIVSKYERVAPNNPHALHMPTHIYTRLGEWSKVIAGNLKAAEAAMLHPAGEDADLVWDEFPHAIEYLVYAHLQRGEDEAAATQLRRLHTTDRLQPSFKTAFHLASTSARFALERGDWQAAAVLEPREPSFLPWDRFLWPEAIVWFARGLGSLRTGNSAEATKAYQKLGDLLRSAEERGEELFARNIATLSLELQAWRSWFDGRVDDAIALLERASQLEIETPKHPVTPGPTLPAQEQLGSLLLELDRPVEALTAYEASLEHFPGRLGALVGAARAANRAGQQAKALDYFEAVLKAAAAGSRTALLDEMRTLLAATGPEV